MIEISKVYCRLMEASNALQPKRYCLSEDAESASISGMSGESVCIQREFVMELNASEREILTQLQRGIAIDASPFTGYAMREPDVVDLLKRAQKSGLVRRFGGVFDSRRLGYKSMLCAIDAAPDIIDDAAAVICQHSGVTHCYERRALDGVQQCPSLWFTIAMQAETFETGIRQMQAQLPANLSIRVLPALKRFKIDVVFDLQPASLAKSCGSTETPLPTSPVQQMLAGRTIPGDPPQYATSDQGSSGASLDTEQDQIARGDVLSSLNCNISLSGPERKLVQLLGGQLPITVRPFDALAAQVDMQCPDLLATLRQWKQQGVLRRIAPILHHRAAGFRANGMCVWPVSGDVEICGRRLAARPEVTHCYQRPRIPGFAFDLFAMIHAGSEEQLWRMFAQISAACGLQAGAVLLSTREFKKSSLQYFAGVEESGA